LHDSGDIYAWPMGWAISAHCWSDPNRATSTPRCRGSTTGSFRRLSEGAGHCLLVQRCPLTATGCCCPGPAARQPFRTTVGPACAPRPTIAFRSPAHSSERQQRLILEPRSCRETRGRWSSRAPSQNAPPADRAMASRHLISSRSGHLLDYREGIFTPSSETHMRGRTARRRCSKERQDPMSGRPFLKRTGRAATGSCHVPLYPFRPGASVQEFPNTSLSLNKSQWGWA